MADYGKSRGLLDYISRDDAIRKQDKRYRGLFGLDPKVSGREQPSIYRDVGGEQQSLWDDTMAMMPIGGITLKHGSPAKFQEFLDKYKLTGEGANAYTSGHYLAEAHKVAMEYVRKLAKSSNWNFTQKVTDKYKDQLKAIDKARAKLEGPKPGEKGFPKSVAEWEKRQGLWTWEDSKKWDNLAKERFRLETKMKQEPGASMTDPSGYLYTAKVKDDVYGKMLDWDKRLTQQKGLLDKIDPKGKIMKDIRDQFGKGVYDDFFDNMRGKDLVRYLQKSNPQLVRHDVEGYLKSRGVPGIKYFDQESRPRYLHHLGRDVAPKKQTRNVVAYEPKDIEIINRQKFDSVLGLLD